jgi:dUTP pyrophosphatase
MEPEPMLRFAKLTPLAYAPVLGSTHAAGFDLKSAYEYTIPPRGRQLVMTDLQIQTPEGCYGRIAARSGLALNNGLDVGAGVIDADYRGNVGVMLFNHSYDEFKVERGARIAQLICERIVYPKLQESQRLTDTERGSKGFGSTGLH